MVPGACYFSTYPRVAPIDMIDGVLREGAFRPEDKLSHPAHGNAHPLAGCRYS